MRELDTRKEREKERKREDIICIHVSTHAHTMICIRLTTCKLHH